MGFYKKASRDKKFSNIREDLLSLSDGNKKRKFILERIRRENVNEMILQSINGLLLGKSLVNFNTRGDFESLDVSRAAKKIEQESSKFYEDASDKAHLILAEASRYFKKLSEENNLRKRKLDDLI